MKLQICVLSMAFTAILTACSDPAAVTTSEENWLGEASVGTIDGVEVPESLFRRLGVTMLQKTAEEMTPQEHAAVLEQLVALHLAANDGLRKELHHERTVAADLELGRLQLLAQAALGRYMEANPIGEAKLRELYEQETANLSGTEYRARHILVETEAEAADLIEQLDAGSDFAELAQEFSTGPTGPSGGDLGWFTSDTMVAPFSEAVQALEVGAHTAVPVQTQFGWHVILLEDTREQQPPGIESMRDQLTELARRQTFTAYLEGLRNAADVAVE